MMQSNLSEIGMLEEELSVGNHDSLNGEVLIPTEQPVVDEKPKAPKRRMTSYEDYEKLRLVEEYKASGKPLRQFCLENNVAKSSLHDWLNDVKKGRLTRDNCTGKKRLSKKGDDSKKIIGYVQDSDIVDQQVRVVADLKALRPDSKLLNIDRIVLHSAEFAKSWVNHYETLERNLQLHPKLREFTLCIVSFLCDSEYNFVHHCAPFLKAGGTLEQLNEMKKIKDDSNLTLLKNPHFSHLEQDVSELARITVKNLKYPKPLLSRLKTQLGERGLVELVGLICNHTARANFTNIFEVGLE